MAIVDPVRGGGTRPPFPGRRLPDAVASSLRRPTAAGTLVLGLLALLAYAAFAHGGLRSSTELRIQVAVAAIAAIAGIAWIWTGSLRFYAPSTALAGLVALLGFAVWSGVSLLWSVAPDQTWIEVNRDLTYVLALGLAMLAGASHRRAVELVATGFLALALLVTVYALGQKVVPGLHVGSVVDLNQTALVPRLQAPLDYWNALALFITLAVPIALAFALDASRSPGWRLGGAIAVQLMLIVIGLTYSRGGLVALALAIAAAIGLGGERLRALVWLALAAVSAVPPLVVGLSTHSLTSAGVALSSREAAGGILGVILLASVAGLYFAGRALLRRESRIRLSATRARGIGRLAVLVTTVGVLAAVIALALSPGGLSGAWHDFTDARSENIYDPNHLLSSDSGNRWVWWNEAAGAASDRPLGGWGAGSFPVVHLLYRRDALSVRQPHSVPLQFLAETGIVGALLGIGGYALLFVAGIGAVRRRMPGSGRLLAAALAAGGVAYAVHALYDWDWDIPGVTLPAMVFLGVLAGARRRDESPAAAARKRRSGSAVALAGLSLTLCSFVVSAMLPRLAGNEASSALLAASSSSPERLQAALADAEGASRLDPLADEGLKAAASIEARRGHAANAEAYLLRAIRRDPNDAGAWEQLVTLQARLGDTHGVVRSVGQLLALDPRGSAANSAARSTYLGLLGGTSAATSTSTPLPSG